MDQADRTPIVLLGSAVALLLIALYWIGTNAPVDITTGTQPGTTVPCDQRDAASDEACAPAGAQSATGGQTTPAGDSADNAAGDVLSNETQPSTSPIGVNAPSADWLDEDVATKPLNPFQQGLGMDPALTDVFDDPPPKDE